MIPPQYRPVVAIVLGGALLCSGFGYGAHWRTERNECRSAVEQITGPAEHYDREATNRYIARCLDR
jgi:hypothetical protein